MELAHGVRARVRRSENAGHVELARVAVDAQPELEHAVERDAARVRPPVAVEQRAGDAPDEVGREALVAGRDRRVDREDAVGADAVQGVVERRAGRDVLPGALREQERRVALVEVPDRRLDAERPQRPDPADAEDELLVEPHLAAADVEDVGDRPVGVAVVGDVGVEQEHRRPADLGEPDRDLEVATRQLDLDLERLAGVGPGRG